MSWGVRSSVDNPLWEAGEQPHAAKHRPPLSPLETALQALAIGARHGRNSAESHSAAAVAQPGPASVESAVQSPFFSLGPEAVGAAAAAPATTPAASAVSPAAGAAVRAPHAMLFSVGSTSFGDASPSPLCWSLDGGDAAGDSEAKPHRQHGMQLAVSRSPSLAPISPETTESPLKRPRLSESSEGGCAASASGEYGFAEPASAEAEADAKTFGGGGGSSDSTWPEMAQPPGDSADSCSSADAAVKVWRMPGSEVSNSSSCHLPVAERSGMPSFLLPSAATDLTAANDPAGEPASSEAGGSSGSNAIETASSAGSGGAPAAEDPELSAAVAAAEMALQHLEASDDASDAASSDGRASVLRTDVSKAETCLENRPPPPAALGGARRPAADALQHASSAGSPQWDPHDSQEAAAAFAAAGVTTADAAARPASAADSFEFDAAAPTAAQHGWPASAASDDDSAAAGGGSLQPPPAAVGELATGDDTDAEPWAALAAADSLERQQQVNVPPSIQANKSCSSLEDSNGMVMACEVSIVKLCWLQG